MFANSPVAVSIPCVDIAIARAFYGGTMGMTELDMPGPEGAPMAFYQGGQGTMLFVYQRSTPTKADHTVAGWMVADVDAAADYLISQGVTLKIYPDMPDVAWDDRGVASMGGMKTAWFTDPDGNILSIAAMP